MSPIELVAVVRFYVDLALSVALAGAAVFAFVEAARASDYAYQSAFKRTKGFWMGVTGASAAFSVLMVLQSWNGVSGSFFIQLIAATAVGVFLADVRPAVAVRRRR